MAGQVAVALLLLIGSALMVLSFARLTRAEPGFDPENVLTLELVLPAGKYPGGREQNLFYDQVVERVRALPGVRNAASAYPLPLNFESLELGIDVPGAERASPDEKLFANSFWVSPGYFGALGIPVLRGRDFTQGDNDASARTVIVGTRSRRSSSGSS